MSEDDMQVLEPYGRYRRVWVELTRSEHQHGGEGWEFGTCLWSPSEDKGHHDRYAIMRQPLRGDLVLHIYHHKWEDGVIESRLCATSRVARPYREVRTEPPSPGIWKGAPFYYRIDLEAYQPLSPPLSLITLEEYYGQPIRDEILQEGPDYYPFSTYGDKIRLAQGMYLAQCTEQLYHIVREALGFADTTAQGDDITSELHKEYAEGQRMARERHFFARNPELVKRAKQYYGYSCQVCGFDYATAYGELGTGYIECHHLNPLSERTEQEWTEGIRTSLDNVAVVCASCHRMLHRRRPALAIEDVRAAWEGAKVMRK